MKKIFLFLFLLPTLAFAQLELPYSIKLVNPKPVDFWYFESDGTPYDNTGEVISQVLSAIRYRGMTFNVNGVEYWFGAGIADGNLVIKTDLSGYIAKTGTTAITGNVLINGGFNFSIGSSGTRPTAIDLYTSGDLTKVATGNIASLSTGGSVTNRYYNGVSDESITNVNSSGVTIANTTTGNVTSNATNTISDGNIQNNTFYTDGTTLFSTRSNHYYDSLYFEASKTDGVDDSLSSITLTHQGIKIRTFTDSPSIGDVLTITGSDGSAKFQTPSGGGSGLTVGTSTITSGTNTKVLYNNSGVLGEYTVSGSGNVAMTTSPTFTTPALGTPSALVGTNITGTATGLTSGITNALKSATTTVDVSAATAPTSGQVLTATSGTAATWQTPASASGAWLLASGGTATGTNTFAMGSNPFILTSGVTTGTGATAGVQNVFNSLTTGNGLDISSSSVSSGAIVKITGTGTAAASNTQKGLWVDISGANSTSTQTTYGSYITNGHTGTGSNNIGLYAGASGGTFNTAAIIDGNLLVGTTSGGARVEIRGVDATSTNYAIAAKNSSGVRTFSVLNDGSVKVPLGDLTLGGGATASQLRFLEPSGSGTNYSSFSAVAQSANINYSLPPTVAVAGAVLTDAAGNGVLTWEDKSLQSTTNTKTEKVIHNVGTIGSAATSTYSIHAESYYANGTTLLAKITVVAVKTDGSASAHSTVTARFRKNSSGTWSVDDAGTDITSDITILADVAGDFSTNPNVKVTMGAASGNYNVSWVAETIEVK